MQTKENRCLAVLAPVITGAALVSGCHLMLPSGGPGAWSQHWSPAPSVKGGLRACRAKGEGAALPSTLLDSEYGLWCPLLMFPTSAQPSESQVPHHKYLQQREACSEKNTDPSCLAPDFRLPVRVPLTFLTRLHAGVLKNNSYNPAGFAATVLWKIWCNNWLIS